MNALGGDAMAMLLKGVATAEAQFAALVVSTDAINFSAGANLMLLLLEAQEGNWDDVDLMVRGFQRATMALRLSKVPVVVAPAGLALGGGCEIALHGDRVQAAAETYLGLVEAGVGLIPAGGGTKEMLARATGHLTLGPSTDLAGPVRTVFETIGFAKTSTSAAEARTLGLLRPVDRVSMNRDRVLADAKALALARVAEGYEAPGAAHRDPGRRGAARSDPEARRPPRPPRRAAERPRRADRAQAGARARRRIARRAGAGRRAVPARSRARGLPLVVRRAEDAGPHQAHARYRQAAAQLMSAAMEIRGSGPPLVLVPGMQGRWEWMTPTVEALARRFRVGTFIPLRRAGRAGAGAVIRGRFSSGSTRSAARSAPGSRGAGRGVVRRPHRAPLRGAPPGAGSRAGARLGAGPWVHAAGGSGALAGSAAPLAAGVRARRPGTDAARTPQRLFRRGARACASPGGCCGTSRGRRCRRRARPPGSTSFSPTTSRRSRRG